MRLNSALYQHGDLRNPNRRSAVESPTFRREPPVAVKGPIPDSQCLSKRVGGKYLLRRKVWLSERRKARRSLEDW